jgi:hypothetical protein
MSFLEEFFFLTFQLFYVLGMVVCFTGLPLFILFWKRWMPKAARTLFWAARRGTPPLLLVHDSGRGEITTVIERKGEGIVMTKEGKYKILPRVMPKTPLEEQIVQKITEAAQEQNPSPDGTPVEVEVDVPEDAKKPSRLSILKDKFILDYSDWIIKRCMLVGMKMPFWVGYTGKLCLLNPEALALYEAGEMVVRTEDKTLFNPNKVEGKTIKDALSPLLLIDSRKIQQIIFNGFDQSQIAGVVADSEEIARLGRGLSKTMISAIIILVIILILGLGMFVLPQIMQP